MNVLDSEMVIADLKRHGYVVVDSPAEADCVLYNTCSVREHAEEKIYSALGTIRQAKENNPEKTIGVMGCMAQKDQEIIFKRLEEHQDKTTNYKNKEFPTTKSEKQKMRISIFFSRYFSLCSLLDVNSETAVWTYRRSPCRIGVA